MFKNPKIVTIEFEQFSVYQKKSKVF